MYSPFTKVFGELSADDLLTLKTVSEGWFVEYKQQLPTPNNIAKSVSAFANHQGGWLFIGVTESKDGHHTAAAFPGVDAATLGDDLNRIRDAVRAHTDPLPHFDVRAITGPSTDGAVPPSRAVLVVRVPQGENSPYLHSSGRIYRRVADSSDPVAETERAVLDLLVERSRDARRRLKKFVTTGHVVSRTEEKTPYMVVFLMQRLFGEATNAADLSFPDFAEMARTRSDSAAVDLSLENAFTMAKGFVARHVGTNDPQLRLFTWELYGDGTSVFTLPLTVRDPRLNAGYKYAEAFCRGLSDSQIRRIIDTNLILTMLAVCLTKHRRALRAMKLEEPTFAKVRLTNLWRKTPFFDSEAFLQHTIRHGLPICQYESTFAPPTTTPETFLELKETHKFGNATSDALAESFLTPAQLFAWVMEALGIPRETISEFAEDLVLAADRTGSLHWSTPNDASH